MSIRGKDMRVSTGHSLRFTSLRLVNWRNFRRVEVELQSKAFFVGPNASGKSNLLDAIRFLSEIAKPGSGGLQAAIDHRGGLSAIRCLHARTTPNVEIEVTIGSDDQPKIWRYSLKIDLKKSEKIPTIVSETIYKAGRRLKIQTRRANSDPLEFSQTLIEQVRSGKDLRELNQFLASCRYTHIVPQIVRDRTRARNDGDDPFGGDLLRRIKEMPRKTRDPRLRRISKALQIAVPQFGNLDLIDDAEGKPHLFASYVHWRAHASKQPETAFSDGTLRLIGLLWAIAERGGPLLLEEPELSLNDGIIQQLPRMFSTMQKLSGRQVIATTHATALLDDVSVGLKEVHLITVDTNGSHVETIYDNAQIRAEVENEMTIGQSVIPRVQPRGITALGSIDV